jgi:uncharacterized membrane protein
LSKNTERSGPRPRIETLSDLIFGLALSIGALSLLGGKQPSSLVEIMDDMIGFGFSFLILISVWLRYTEVMSVLPVETKTTIFLNVIMLFLVSVEPYLFNLVEFSLFGHAAQSELLDYTSILFALDMAGLMAILAFFTHQLAIEEKKLISPELLWKYKRTRNFLFLSAGLFVLTLLPQFWSWKFQDTPLRFYFWFAPLAVSWIRRISERPPKTQSNI